MNEVEAEIKSLKVNGIAVIPQFGNFPFKGSFWSSRHSLS